VKDVHSPFWLAFWHTLRLPCAREETLDSFTAYCAGSEL
jgi:hypothetical protein